MKTSDFFFELPEELIAQHPTNERGESRLLVMDRKTGALTDSNVKDLVQFLPENSLMVFNNSRVRKARIYGTSETGGKVEFLLLSTKDNINWRCLTKKAKKQRIGKRFLFEGGRRGIIAAEDGDFRILQFEEPIDDAYLDIHGHIPLPPYIRRNDTNADASRYQTIYAQTIGSAAAPTAGLHFTEPILESIKQADIQTAYVTLHVGMSTFSPVRTEVVEEHTMHTEEYEIDKKTMELINASKENGKPIIAVGTTSLRTLESAADPQGLIKAGKGSTDLFVYPGYKFKTVNGLFTNFHTPDSSLILLVSAFGGTEAIKNAYKHAVSQRYRFFSYGDAMFIKP